MMSVYKTDQACDGIAASEGAPPDIVFGQHVKAFKFTIGLAEPSFLGTGNIWLRNCPLHGATGTIAPLVTIFSIS